VAGGGQLHGSQRVDQSAVSVRSRSEILTDALLQHGGITVASVLIGLVLYSLTILARNIIEGLRGIPDDVLEAARGMGYGLRRQDVPMVVAGAPGGRGHRPGAGPGHGGRAALPGPAGASQEYADHAHEPRQHRYGVAPNVFRATLLSCRPLVRDTS
jgi:hypothetical protein